jgi:aldehyde:ferredoxin oxidoreductase
MEQVEFDPKSHTTAEKVKALRDYREDRYEKLVDAVYKRRGWDERGIPNVETLKRLGIDFPDVLKLIKSNQNK